MLTEFSFRRSNSMLFRLACRPFLQCGSLSGGILRCFRTPDPHSVSSTNHQDLPLQLPLCWRLALPRRPPPSPSSRASCSVHCRSLIRVVLFLWETGSREPTLGTVVSLR